MKYKLIIGLGNPGEKYKNTYHNIGFSVIDYLTKNLTNLPFARQKKFAYIKQDKLIFAKPLAYMNNSGEVVKEILRHFKVKPEQSLIIHDDSDIEIGKYKLSFNRGSAGHLGVESIIKQLGTKKFFRLRIGTRRIGDKRKAKSIVLKKISQEERKIFIDLFCRLKQILLLP